MNGTTTIVEMERAMIADRLDELVTSTQDMVDLTTPGAPTFGVLLGQLMGHLDFLIAELRS